MANGLRDPLETKAVEITHSGSLEPSAHASGFANWNILSAKIEAAGRRAEDGQEPSLAGAEERARLNTLYCTFCDKSQHDVKRLISGPSAYLCDKCVELCTKFLREERQLRQILQSV